MLHDCCVCSMCYHYIISVCLWYDVIDITRLLRMIYVLWLVLDGNSSREGFAISSYGHFYAGFYDSFSVCIYLTGYSIYIYYLHFCDTTYYVFLTNHRVNVKV